VSVSVCSSRHTLARRAGLFSVPYHLASSLVLWYKQSTLDHHKEHCCQYNRYPARRFSIHSFIRPCVLWLACAEEPTSLPESSSTCTSFIILRDTN
jgi:hypothetical protein